MHLWCDCTYTVCVCLYECIPTVMILCMPTGCGTVVHGRWPILFQPSNTSRPTVTFLQMETTWCPAAMALEARAVKPRWDHWRCLCGYWLYRCTEGGLGWGCQKVNYCLSHVNTRWTPTAINMFCIEQEGQLLLSLMPVLFIFYSNKTTITHYTCVNDLWMFPMFPLWVWLPQLAAYTPSLTSFLSNLCLQEVGRGQSQIWSS